MIMTHTAEAVKRFCSAKGARDYQLKLYHDIHDAWEIGHRNVIAVMPTGAGKTFVLSAVVQDHNGASCVIAHRQELVSQISVALAKNQVRHRIIGPNKLIRMIVAMQMRELGESWYDPSARCAVAGVDTLVRRTDQLSSWIPTVTLWVTDESHHCAAVGGKRNKWMTATDLFVNAKGLGVTATPTRSDGAGLGRHHDGVFDTMILGPTMRVLIDRGFLTKYRIFAPPSDLDMSEYSVSKTTGDYKPNDVRNAVEHSSLVVTDDSDGKQITGDVVKFYQQRFNGMLSVVFVPSVATSKMIAQEFNDAGIPAMSLDGNTPDDIRAKAIRDFGARHLQVLVNVGLFSEGFDCPAIEVVQDAYPTQSYSLFCQRFGRMLRLADGKEFGIYSDHAGNVKRHGLPDAPREWTLDRREKRSGQDDVTPTRTCMNDECFAVYERYLKECPFCGAAIEVPTPTERTGPEFVDGDLYELDEATLAAMRGEVAKVDTDTEELWPKLTQTVISEATNEYAAQLRTPQGINRHSQLTKFSRKFENQYNDDRANHPIQAATITALRECMAMWAGHHRAAGSDDGEIFRRFYLKFNVDWLSAQALNVDPAEALMMRVATDTGNLI